MSKQLIDRGKTFEIYFSLGTSRSLSKLHKYLAKKYPKSSPSYPTLKNWAKAGSWKNAAEIKDAEINAQVQAAMIPVWVNVKVELIQAFINQINTATKAGIAAENSRDMVAVSKELRALLGEADKHEVKNILEVQYEDFPAENCGD